MPIYEYRCGDCGQQFELLVRTGTTSSCPHCQSQALERLTSLFGVSSPATRQTALKVGRQEHQKTQRDKDIAHRDAVRKHDDH